MFLRPKHFLLILAGLFGGLFFLNLLMLKWIEMQRSLPFGQFTEAQMLAKAEPLCAALHPESYRWSLVTSKIDGRVGGRSRRVWQVQALDADQNSVAELNWDAETGDLASLSYRQLKHGMTGDLLHTEKQAVEAALTWLRAFQVVADTSRIRLLKPPAKTGSVWDVHFRAEDRIVRIGVSGRDDYVILTCWRDESAMP